MSRDPYRFKIETEVVYLTDSYAEAFALAMGDGQVIFDHLDECEVVIGDGEAGRYLGVPNGVYCEGCRGCVFPGIRWPTEANCDTDRSWVERCDQCGRYDSDDDAAEAIVAYYEDAGAEIKSGHATPAGSSSSTPYVEVD